jgi:hypothetical protein
LSGSGGVNARAIPPRTNDDPVRDGAREERTPRARVGRFRVVSLLRCAGLGQSICLRMNVGISMSLRSCSARSVAVQRGRRADVGLGAAGRVRPVLRRAVRRFVARAAE